MKLSKLFELICLATIAIGCVSVLVIAACFEGRKEYMEITVITVSAMTVLSGYEAILNWDIQSERIRWISLFIFSMVALLFLVNQVVL